MVPDNSDELIILDDALYLDSESSAENSQAWKLAVIDDDESVYQSTRLALEDSVILNRDINILPAFSGKEGLELFLNNSDIAVAFIDVVMETETAGLDLVEKIRNELKNTHVRLIVRTGQPGLYPDKKIVNEYDIDGYLEKSELTFSKLYISIATALRSYRNLIELEQSKMNAELANKEKLEVYRATVSGSQHIINNFLNQLQLVELEIKNHSEFDIEVIEELRQMKRKASHLLNQLSSVANVNAESIKQSVYPK